MSNAAGRYRELVDAAAGSRAVRVDRVGAGVGRAGADAAEGGGASGEPGVAAGAEGARAVHVAADRGTAGGGRGAADASDADVGGERPRDAPAVRPRDQAAVVARRGDGQDRGARAERLGARRGGRTTSRRSSRGWRSGSTSSGSRRTATATRGHIYNALLEDFEPGETAENLTKVFESLRGPLVELIGKIVSSGRKAPLEILERNYPAAGQAKLAREAAAAVGFDFDAGRLDVSRPPVLHRHRARATRG